MSFLNQNASLEWSDKNKFLLRFLFIYFLIQIIPLDYKFYQDLLTKDVGEGFYLLFKAANYSPQFFGLLGYQNWLVIAAIFL
ncbi:MAG: hypothetical protein EOO85_33740 [Pedobacter sp.]|nr:MAG: hypothetical protein EOO85_33740 [Pedobacter sp.]